jgi:hypothetical protein
LGEFEPREWIAFGIIATLFVGATAASLVYRQKARWRKLRMAGNAQAKKRELERQR